MICFCALLNFYPIYTIANLFCNVQKHIYLLSIQTKSDTYKNRNKSLVAKKIKKKNRISKTML